MEIDFIQIEKLCRQVEATIGWQPRSPRQFDELADLIFASQHEHISTTTLKRLWGYVKSDAMPRTTTLDILAHIIGCRDWETFTHLSSESQSYPLLVNHIHSSSLAVGDVITLRWMPNRYMTIEYLGDNQFVVRDSHNSKISEGDTFYCSLFVDGESLMFGPAVIGGNEVPAYIIGQRDGIKIEKG